MTTGTEQQQMPRRRARWLCLAALALSALFPVSIALAVLADRLALSVVGMLVVMGGGRLIARAGGYRPASSWESSDVGALADPHLRRLMAWGRLAGAADHRHPLNPRRGRVRRPLRALLVTRPAERR